MSCCAVVFKKHKKKLWTCNDLQYNCTTCVFYFLNIFWGPQFKKPRSSA